MLAGLLVVNEGKAPGRPPGVEPRSSLAGGPQRAIRPLYVTIVLKELAMKTFIIATILSVGVLLRPEMAPNINCLDVKYAATTTVSIGVQTVVPRVMERAETMSIHGGGIAECVEYYDGNNDEHQLCCLNLWFFKLCFDVNLSEVKRFISSLF